MAIAKILVSILGPSVEQKRWTRPDAHCFIRPDWRRFVKPGYADQFPFSRYERKYSPHQPRVPAGMSEGGQWTSEGSTSAPRTKPLGSDRRVQVAGDITGFRRHGLDRAISRGVAPRAILDAVVNPIQILPQANGTTRYVGTGAVVVLNPAGEVVTVWPR